MSTRSNPVFYRCGNGFCWRDDYCDGLGDCLPACPAQAITFVEREAVPYNEQAVISRLRQWPLQIRLVSPKASWLDGAHLLIAADCTAYAYGNFHKDFMQGKVTLVGCPKLDACDYGEKLADIIAENRIRKVTVIRMEVPCCKGIVRAAEAALKNSGKSIPLEAVTLSVDGRIQHA